MKITSGNTPLLIATVLLFSPATPALAKDSKAKTKTGSAHQITADAAAPILKKKKIQLGKKTITVEIADNEETRERGLMFRKSLASDSGMIFVFQEARPVSFWMKNTLIPLSIGYFDSGKRLIEVHEMVPAVMGETKPTTYPSSGDVQFALEMPPGWFSRNGIKNGTTFKFLD